MKPIKFRAWDGKEMNYEDESGSISEPYRNEQIAKFLSDNYACDLMQFTGLHDKNGKEIYEGDILYWDGSIIGAVSFEHCEFIVGKGVNARAMCAIRDDLEISVIGNIYENPELIEVTP